MKRMMMFAIGVLLGAGTALSQTTIRMRENAAVAIGAPVTVADVAAVTGDDSGRLGALVVVETSKEPALSVDRAAVKKVLDAAGVNWAKTTLAGGTTSVKFGDALPGSSPTVGNGTLMANTPVTPAESGNERGTLQELIGNQLAAAVDVRRADLRVRFDQLPAADADWVRQAAQKGWQYEVRMIGTSLNGRSPVRVEAYERDRLALSRTIMLEVLVRRDVPTAAAGIARDQIITDSDISVQTSWLPTNQAGRPPALEELIGSCAKRGIGAGKAISAADVQAPVIVKRGDEVWVHCISGGMVVKTKARALGTARNGEMVSLQVDGSKKTFSARMNGRGRAVMNLDGVADEGASSDLSHVQTNGSQR